MVICLERGADLHTVQLTPLPLTVSCFSKIQIGFTFLVPAYLGSPGKGPLNACVCVTYFNMQMDLDFNMWISLFVWRMSWCLDCRWWWCCYRRERVCGFRRPVCQRSVCERGRKLQVSLSDRLHALGVRQTLPRSVSLSLIISCQRFIMRPLLREPRP